MVCAAVVLHSSVYVCVCVSTRCVKTVYIVELCVCSDARAKSTALLLHQLWADSCRLAFPAGFYWCQPLIKNILLTDWIPVAPEFRMYDCLCLKYRRALHGRWCNEYQERFANCIHLKALQNWTVESHSGEANTYCICLALKVRKLSNKGTKAISYLLISLFCFFLFFYLY